MILRQTYQVLGRELTFETNVEKAASLVDRLYRSYRYSGAVDAGTVYRLTYDERIDKGRSPWRLNCPDGRTKTMETIRDALYLTEATICEGLFSRLPDHYALHCALVHGPTGGVLIGGKSGAGKSTLSLALHASGLTIAGDDIALLHAETGLVQAAPRCFHLDDASIAMLQAEGMTLPQDGLDHAFVVPGDLTDTAPLPCRARFVFHIEPGRRDKPEIEPVSQSDMASALLKETSLSQRSDFDCTIALAEMVGHCRCFQIWSGGLRDTVSAVRRVVLSSVGSV